MRPRLPPAALALPVAGLLLAAAIARAEPYQPPPPAVLEVLKAPAPPVGWVSPVHDAILLGTPVRFPPITDLAQPFLRLAGVRLTPRNNGVHGASYLDDLSLVKVSGGAPVKLALPAPARITRPLWSADGQRFAFARIGERSIELWVGETATARVRRIDGVALDPLLGDELQWMPDSRTLLCKRVPPGRGPAPADDAPPEGPRTLESSGETVPSSTYEARDLLRSPHDADLFEHYAKSEPVLVDADSGATTLAGPAAIYGHLAPAPDGVHVLVERLHRPFSYLSGYERFPRDVEVWRRQGASLRSVWTVARLPLAESVPIWGVRTGPREFDWRPTEPATLVWAEALDGGDWKNKVPARDRLWMARVQKAEPTGAPVQPLEIGRTAQRFTGFAWGEQPGFALRTEVDQIKHWTRTFIVDVDHPARAPRKLWDRSFDDQYKNPGQPVYRVLPSGHPVIEQRGSAIHLAGTGASPEGDRPFLDRLDTRTLATERLFRSDRASVESFAAWVDAGRGRFLTRRESPTEPPHFAVRTLGPRHPAPATGEASFDSTLVALTTVADPTPALRGIVKRLVRYQRADGVELSFTLYLPPGYKEGTRLPAVVWAYPLDYADARVAGQVSGSPQRFTQLGWPLQLFFLLDGYAVIDNPSLPVVGDTNTIYDTYLEQLVAGAEAAVKKASELGVVDPERIGVTGHSHGGLMTVNLMAHSKLFRAGIARSGAYNRTLTAFGFQNERRTLWQARDVYLKVSPLFAADRIKDPLLLIHGEADYNPGTTPLQSEKLYEAVRGTGGTARLVMLPFESHGYRALESTGHVLHEMLAWFDRYVKHAPPRSPAAAAR